MLRYAAAAALVFSIGTAQAEQTPNSPWYYAGGADLIEPGHTTWTYNTGITVQNNTYAGCVAQLNYDLDYRLDNGWTLHQLHPCHIVRPGFGTAPADRVLTRADLVTITEGTNVLRERYRIDQYEAEVNKLLFAPKR
jgi:hypothetical protein